MYTICDTKAEIYYPPFYKNTHGEAERDFQKACNDPKSTIHDNPEDFDLFYVGEYDDSNGKITPVVTPQHIVKAVHFKNKKGPQEIDAI